jgi:acetate---CoA ligase (ADP-forming)
MVPSPRTSLQALFNPRSIAIVGMTDRVTFCSRVYKRLVEAQFSGEIYFVNPGRTEVLGRPCYPSVAAIGRPVDVMLLSVSPAQLAGAIEDGIRSAVKSAVVYTTGVDDDEVENIRSIIATDGQFRMLGPNTLGMVTPAQAHGLPYLLPLAIDAGQSDGHVALLMQSGGLGSVAAVELARRQAGLRTFIDTGNELNISIADCIDYLTDDASIKVIAAFIEAVRDMPAFLAAARRARDHGKHIVVLKVGRSLRGAAATLLHTGSLAGDARLYRSIFEQHGILMCREIPELVNAVQAAAFGSFPRTAEIAVVSGSGGACALMSDLAEECRLSFAPLDVATTALLKTVLPPYTNMSNPIDLSGIEENKLRTTMMALGQDRAVGATVFFASHLDDKPMLCDIFQQCRDTTGMPIYLAGDGDAVQQRMQQAGFPTFTYPDSAIRTLASMNRWAMLEIRASEQDRLRHATSAQSQTSTVNQATARCLAQHRAAGSRLLTEFEGKQLLATVGFKVPRGLLTDSARCSAALVHAKLDFPVAAKLSSRLITHKAAIGGVRLHLHSVVEVEAACSAMMAIDMADETHAFLIEEMAPPGMEFILGGRVDPNFGAVVIFGKGGAEAEAAADVAIRLAPVNQALAQTMLAELKVALPADTTLLVELIVAMSNLIAGHSRDLQEIEINPVIVSRNGLNAVAADAVTVLRDATAG